MRVVYTDPDCEMTVRFVDPMEVIFGEAAAEPDITLSMPADIADRFWRGKYNLAVGLARSEVKAKGPVNKILKLVPRPSHCSPSTTTSSPRRTASREGSRFPRSS